MNRCAMCNKKHKSVKERADYHKVCNKCEKQYPVWSECGSYILEN